MALTARSLFLYNIEVTELNNKLDFQADSGGSILETELALGYYSAAGLADEIVRAMKDVDSVNNYTATVDRSILGGTQNRVIISTSGTFLSLLFASGPNNPTNCSAVIGFNATDYTGDTSYTGSTSIGTSLVPIQLGYNYLNDDFQGKVFGSVNVSASGLKESVVFNIQKFIDVEYRYEPASRRLEWKNFFLWAIQQREFDFIPEISDPDVVYRVTLEKTGADSKGLAFRMKEMLPNFPNYYETGNLNLRVIDSDQQFV